MKNFLLILLLGINTVAMANNYQSGTGAVALSDYTTAVGAGAVAVKKQSTSIGAEAYTPNEKATAVGAFSTATGINSIAVGTGSHAYGDNSIAIGTVANAGNHISNGIDNNPKTANTIAIGNLSSAQNFNSVAIGTLSHTTRENEVNIGYKTNSGYKSRLLGNVTDGILDTDAVNKRQLNMVKQSADESLKQAKLAEYNANTYTDQKIIENNNIIKDIKLVIEDNNKSLDKKNHK